MESGAERAPNEVNSLRKAIAVLNAIAEHGDAGARLVDIVAHTGLRRATAHRLCRTFQALGWVRQPQNRRRYYLGSAVATLVSLAPSRRVLAEAGRGALERIAAECEDTAFLFLHDGLDALCVERREGDYPVKPLVVSVGDRRPLGLGAGGLAILAFLPADERAATLDALLAHREGCRKRGRAAIEAAVATTRRAGFVKQASGIVPGVAGIGVPIMGAGGAPVGAISVAGIESRWPDRRKDDFAAMLHAEAHRIARSLDEAVL